MICISARLLPPLAGEKDVKLKGHPNKMHFMHQRQPNPVPQTE